MHQAQFWVPKIKDAKVKEVEIQTKEISNHSESIFSWDVSVKS